MPAFQKQATVSKSSDLLTYTSYMCDFLNFVNFHTNLVPVNILVPVNENLKYQ